MQKLENKLDELDLKLKRNSSRAKEEILVAPVQEDAFFLQT